MCALDSYTTNQTYCPPGPIHRSLLDVTLILILDVDYCVLDELLSAARTLMVTTRSIFFTHTLLFFIPVPLIVGFITSLLTGKCTKKRTSSYIALPVFLMNIFSQPFFVPLP